MARKNYRQRQPPEEPEEPRRILPEGWRLPTPKEVAQGTTLKLRRQRRYWRDGWRRLVRGQWWPSDAYGRKQEFIEAVRGDVTERVGRRFPVDKLGETAVRFTQHFDDSAEPDCSVSEYDGREAGE